MLHSVFDGDGFNDAGGVAGEDEDVDVEDWATTFRSVVVSATNTLSVTSIFSTIIGATDAARINWTHPAITHNAVIIPVDRMVQDYS